MTHKLYFNQKKEDISNPDSIVDVIISGIVNGEKVLVHVECMNPDYSVSINYTPAKTAITNVNPGYLDEPIPIESYEKDLDCPSSGFQPVNDTNLTKE